MNEHSEIFTHPSFHFGMVNQAKGPKLKVKGGVGWDKVVVAGVVVAVVLSTFYVLYTLRTGSEEKKILQNSKFNVSLEWQ